MSTSLDEKLKPKHLLDAADPADMVKSLEGNLDETLAENTEEKLWADDPRSHSEYVFNLSYKDASGKVWEGTFKTKILTIKERLLSGSFRAQLISGLTGLDKLTDDLAYSLSHLQYCLLARPEWAKNLLGLHDFGIINAIMREVSSHEDFFLNGGEA